MPKEDTTEETTEEVTDETSVDDASEVDDEPDPEGSDQLADAGKKALDAMKTQRNAERQKRRDLEGRIAELEKPKGDTPDAAAITATATKAERDRGNARILRSEIKAAAKGVLADAADAFKFLDLSKFDVSDDGEVDEDEIADQLADLIKSKPYLAAQSGKRFQGSGDGGPRNGGSVKSQLSEADMASMTPAAIDKARLDGRFDKLLGKS